MNTQQVYNPRLALNKAFLKVKPTRSSIEKFKYNLVHLLNAANNKESEEFHKNLLSDFLKQTYYSPDYFINTKGRNDLVIHNGKTAQTPVGVIIEAKRPGNLTEIPNIANRNFNVKSFHELILYYLRERITNKNLEIKHLIITNLREWFIFDAQVFERLFAADKELVKQFSDFEEKRLSGVKTEFFYKHIAEPAVVAHKSEIICTHFNFKDYEKPLRNNNKGDDKQLIALFKLLSPEHLLKLPFLNDSNILDKGFYAELLHIIGLTEAKDGGKKIIQRKPKETRDAASLLENTISQIDSLGKIDKLDNLDQYGKSREERLFNIGLELVITWINRILFLKLLEAQLIAYHKGNRNYSFLNFIKIQNYDDLNSLFFQVLARRVEDRTDEAQVNFYQIPYLNSSLFELTDIEDRTIVISNLRDERELQLWPQTVLKDQIGKKLQGKKNTLAYLLTFLDAYDFSSEGSEDIQEENKTLINASVLGLIFEKINGYKDGSFFTPGFITMYMSRETIRKAVLQKFNESKGWSCDNFEELYNCIDDIKEANTLINSIKICDPAVGSGHFLVSALNEMIAVKNDLKILCDRQGKRLKEYNIEVVNDELVVIDDTGGLFQYNPSSQESQRVQETLFHEKEVIIENCLFGVDINPNSVKICQLRLWIELLKNAYYKPGKDKLGNSELETLPNIDINIKRGNSLMQRFALDADLKPALQKSNYSISAYKAAVQTYRNAESKEQKWEMKKLIHAIKSDFESYFSLHDSRLKKLAKKRGELATLTTTRELFASEKSEKEKKDLRKKVDAITKEIAAIEQQIDEVKTNHIYDNALEWRFEFPEVLDDDGNFIGFDVIIGNPPYIQLQKMGKEGIDLQRMNYLTYEKTGDIYSLFYELGYSLIRSKGLVTLITSNKWMRAGYGESLRKFFVERTDPLALIDFAGVQIFDAATVDTNILMFAKDKNRQQTQACMVKDKVLNNLSVYFRQNAVQNNFSSHESWVILSPIEQSIKEKIERIGTPLKDWDINIYRGILTGYNEAFIIDGKKKDELIAADPKSAEIIRPILRGRDIKRYSYDFDERYLIATFPSRNYNIDHYPALKSFLEGFKPKLKQTGETLTRQEIEQVMAHAKANGISLKETDLKTSRKKTNNKWFETQDSISYWDDFSKQKIIYPEITKFLSFYYDEKAFYINNKCFIITGEHIHFLTAFLNSSLFKYCFKDNFPELLGGTRELRKVFLEQIPVTFVSPNINEKFKSMLERIHLTIQHGLPTKSIELEVDEAIFDLYSLTLEERKVIGFIEIQ